MPETDRDRSAAKGRRILYLTYDGLCDPIGQSQVLPYLVGCARAGHAMTVVSFEKANRLKAIGEHVGQQCRAEGLDWRPQRFRSSPPILAKLVDQMAMLRAGSLAAREGIELIHARSYVAGATALRLKRKFGGKFLFDMRGFWPDQRREGGRWPGASLLGRLLYKRWKRLESRMLDGCDHIICLTWAAKAEVQGWRETNGKPISVIPCCADFELFAPAKMDQKVKARAELGISRKAPVLAYLGSIGTVYLLDQQLRLFEAVRKVEPDVVMLFVGQADKAPILAEARRVGVTIDQSHLRCIRVERFDVPYWLGAADVGTCFITPTFSSLGVSPTKLAEYLACGIPVIGNRGVGDVEEIVKRTKGGHVMQDFSAAECEHAAHAYAKLRKLESGPVRESARPLLDLPRAIEAYRVLYDDPGSPVGLALR